MKKTQKKMRKKDKDAINFNMKESKAEFEKGEKEFRKRHIKKAHDHFLAATDKCQENHEAHARLAEVLIELKDYVKAHQHLETAIHYSQKCARYHYLKGKIFFNSGQWEEALGEFKRAMLEDGPDKEVVFPYMVAEMYFKLGKYDEAIENYREAEKAVANFDQGRGKFTKYSLESRILADVTVSY